MPQPLQPEPVLRYLRSALGPDVDGPSDAELLTRFVAEREQAAFELLVWRHAGMVLRVARRVLRDHHAAEDVTQATFLTLARKARSIGRGEAVGAWLYKVAYRLALRHAVRQVRAQTVRDDHSAESIPNSAEPDDEAFRLLHDELARLPDKYRAPVLLCYFDGLTQADAARRLGWPLGTVAGRIARAKDWLHHRLEGRVALPAAGVLGLIAADSAPALGPNFVASTARAATLFAVGQSTLDVSPTVIQLAQGVLHTMTVSKLQWTAGVLLTCCALTVGGFYAAGQIPGGLPGSGGGPGTGIPAAPSGRGAEDGLAVHPDRQADFAQRRRSQQNLKQILLAIHSYHDAHGRFPQDITDASGKPLLSWRVELLPYLEQDALRRQFRTNEPWDSEHNMQLMAKMPEVFRVGFEPKAATHTYYQRFRIAPFEGAGLGGGDTGGGAGGLGGPAGGSASGGLGSPPPGVGAPGLPGSPPGPGSGLPLPGGSPSGPGGVPVGSGGFGPPGGGSVPGGPGMSGSADGAEGGGGFGPGAATSPRTGPQFPTQMASITDGTSNTIGVIEAGPAVPWTKPADFVIARQGPLPKMISPFANTLNVGMLDGTSVSLRPALDAKVLRTMIVPDDGLVLPDVKTLRARFPADSEQEKKALEKLLDENQLLISQIEKQLQEHAQLLARVNGVAKDLNTAEEHQAELMSMLEAFKARNQKLRDELGLRPGTRVPQKKI